MSYDSERDDDYYDDEPGRKPRSMSPLVLVLIIVGGAVGLIGGIGFFVGMATVVIQKGRVPQNRTLCMNNLRQLGALLVIRQSEEGLKPYDGPAFLLQVADMIPDDDLSIFICPAEPEGAAPDRPPVGSAEFIRMYRDLKPSDLTKDLDWSRYTSYAGPNWRSFPMEKGVPGTARTRLWACDACAEGHPHHDGIAVLYASSKVDFLTPENLEGMSGDKILVGPGSPDPLLKKMIFATGR